MLTSRILLRRGQVSYLKWSCATNRRFAQAAEDSEEITINLDVRLATLPKKKPQRPPFVKNMFLGIYDNTIIEYPEVQTNERQNQFNEWLAPIEECVNSNFDPKETDENILPFQAIEQLKELGVFRASLSLEDRGFGLTATEYAKLVEVLGKNPALANYVASRTEPIKILAKYGSEEQKRQYLPRFMNGELIPTSAFLEGNSDGDKTLIDTTATLTPCGEYWQLCGKKIYVANANQANCFIILANCTETHDPLHKSITPSVFIVERGHGGINSSKTLEKLGQRALEVCEVNLTDTLIPRKNLIGKIGDGQKILLDLLTEGKYSVGSQAIAILKSLIHDITEYAINKKHFGQELMTCDFAQEVIAKLTVTLYTIESMTYLTTGLIDQYENQDVNVENAIVEAYCSRECVTQVFQALQLIGKQCYRDDSTFQRIYRDALALNFYNETIIDLYSYIAVKGLQHTGKNAYDAIVKRRNPLLNPKFILKELFTSKEGPDLGIEEHLHPSLLASAKLLQNCVFLLHESTHQILVNHGSKAAEFDMELRRLTEMAIDVYAMSAVLARSSRSYCIGLKHSKDDIFIAHIVCFNSFNRVKINNADIDAGDTQNCDDLYRKISRRVVQQKGYFPEHPLAKNF